MSSADHTLPRPQAAPEPGADLDIHKVIARLRADLQTVEEAIRSLERMAPESQSKPACGPSKPRPVIKVVDINAKRRRSG